ncbi:hypothetical protein [Ferrovibrio sp.]|uniref:hypothetical protein n=1 Tax=Ferrovibrio sp. TaxID=1917215 RepID=UPI003515F22E
MPKPKRIIDRSEIFHGLILKNVLDGFGEYFGAIEVDGETVSYCIAEGEPVCPTFATELMISIEAIATRFPQPWALPAAIHVSEDDGLYRCSITTRTADEAKHFCSAAVIEELFRLHLPRPTNLYMHIFIGEYERHREFHLHTAAFL